MNGESAVTALGQILDSCRVALNRIESSEKQLQEPTVRYEVPSNWCYFFVWPSCPSHGRTYRRIIKCTQTQAARWIEHGAIESPLSLPHPMHGLSHCWRVVILVKTFTVMAVYTCSVYGERWIFTFTVLKKKKMRKKLFDPFAAIHRAQFQMETFNFIEMENLSPSTYREREKKRRWKHANWYLPYAIVSLFRVAAGRNRELGPKSSRAMIG